MTISAIFAPLLGGVIGYITNDIAIKMLFRPRKAIYLGQWKLPFTPGLIPQQKDRIARSVGDVVSSQLLNEETLRAAVLSEESLRLVREKTLAFLDSCANCGDTVAELASRVIGEAHFRKAADAVERGLEELLLRKIRESDLGAEIVRSCMNLLRKQLGIGENSPIFQQLMEQVELALGAALHDLVIQLAPELIHNEVHRFGSDFQDARICDLYDRYQDKLPTIADGVVLLYEKLLGENLGKVLRAVDISGIIAKKISAFDAVQLENLIFDLMRRELKAIVYLGALLGFLMGLLNLLFQL